MLLGSARGQNLGHIKEVQICFLTYAVNLQPFIRKFLYLDTFSTIYGCLPLDCFRHLGSMPLDWARGQNLGLFFL